MATRRRLLLAGAILSMASAAPLAAENAAGDAGLTHALERTEAVRSVRDLHQLFSHHVEAGDWNAAATLFAAESTLDLAGETAAGRRAIGALLQRRFGAGRDGRPAGALHALLAMAPVVTLSPDGESAKARWHEVGLFGGAGVSDNWTGGIYENSYVLKRGRWRIAAMTYNPQFKGSYALGWRNAVDDLGVTPYHYAAETVGVPATLSGTSSRSTSPIAPGLLAARAQRLADEDAVRNLQSILGYYTDRRMWDDVVDLFAAGGSYASADIGSYAGAAAIRAALEREGPAGLNHGDLNDHPYVNVIVCISPDGLAARARGLDLGMTGNNAGRAFWSLTLFDNLFAKEGDVWRIESVRQYPRMRTDSATSWNEGIQQGPAPARSPDGPAPAEPAPLTDCAPATPSTAGLDPELARRQIDAAAATIAIDNVSNAFANYIDDFQWESLSKTFTRNGAREAPGVGFYRTPARIHRMQSTRYGPLASPRTGIPVHARIQPVVHLAADGRSAKLRVRLLQFNSALTTSGGVMAGIYEDEARLEDGAWRLSLVEIDHYLQTRGYVGAWTSIPEGLGARMIPNADRLLRDLPPDSPLVGEIAAPYPAIGRMWFHYDNPVSGRSAPMMTPKTAAVMSRAEEPLAP
jgi:hypothetical protein